VTGPGPIERQSRLIHGYRRSFVHVGQGPAVLLIHGIGDSSETWADVIPLLAAGYTVIAPDLLGHGDSDKPRADYSLGGFANGMRDLLLLLGIGSATVVGHSLGGGVALQFAYQYPQMCQRLVLVASGGLGTEVNPLLRVAAAPGAGVAIAASSSPLVRWPASALLRGAARAGLIGQGDVVALSRVWDGLTDASTRSAFLRTLRSVVDLRGQAVASRDRLYLTESVPLMLVWGDRDPVIPVAHARAAAEAMPHCRLHVIARAGHLPHQADPRHFVGLVADFVSDTVPAVHDPLGWRALLDARSGEAPGVCAGWRGERAPSDPGTVRVG
jgi:pimeloyl-ACP methyl ester carboxylesterase